MKQKLGNISNSNVSGVNINGNENSISNTINTRHSKWPTLLSILSFVSSVGVWVSLYFTIQHGTAITNDSFIGAIGGLMGICATIIVGFQIYNFIDISKKIQDSNNQYNNHIIQISSKQQELEALISQTKDELKKSRSDNNLQFNFLQSYINIVQAMVISEKQPFSAFLSWYCAMKYAAIANDHKLITLIMHNLEKLYRDIKSFDDNKISEYIKNDDNENIRKAQSVRTKNIKITNAYQEAQDRFEEIASEIKEIIYKNQTK